MSSVGLLPRRWRADPHSAAYLEAIAHVLDTAPILPTPSGPAIFAEIGTTAVLPVLVAAKSLHHRLGRGRFVLLADNTLTGADRTILAHHLGDPEFVSATVRDYPRGLPWYSISAAMASRRGEYCMALSPNSVAGGALPEVEQSLAANRSFASMASPGALTGFAAGGPPPPEPANFHAALGDDISPGAQLALLMQREISPASLGRELAFHVPTGSALAAASCAAIAALG